MFLVIVVFHFPDLAILNNDLSRMTRVKFSEGIYVSCKMKLSLYKLHNQLPVSSGTARNFSVGGVTKSLFSHSIAYYLVLTIFCLSHCQQFWVFVENYLRNSVFSQFWGIFLLQQNNLDRNFWKFWNSSTPFAVPMVVSYFSHITLLEWCI